VVEEIFEKRLLRKIPPDNEKVRKSLETADKYFAKINKLQSINDVELILITSYMAMFHAARALLYKEGIQEKSHFAIYVYLKETHKELESQAIEFNIMREQRHESVYGFDVIFTQEDSAHHIETARSFVEKIKETIK
jgi:uncharacterized protein (UPF0332 family)